MRPIRRHHANTVIYLAVSVASKGVSVLLIPTYTSHLSRADYAAYGLAQTIVWIAPALMSLALSNALSRFYFDHTDAEPRDRVMGSIAVAIIASALGTALLAQAIVQILPKSPVSVLSKPQLTCVLWTCAAAPVAEISMSYFRVSERAGRFAAVNLGGFALTVATTLYMMVLRNRGLDGLLYGMLAGQLGPAAFSIYFTWRALRPKLDWSLFVEAARYSIPFIPHMVGNALMIGVDRWALEYYAMRDDLGLYTLATQLSMPVMLATSAWNEASSPRFIAAWRDGGEPAARKALPRVIFGFLLSGFVALVAILVAMPILRRFVGARFQGAFPLVPWVGLSWIIGTLFSAFVNVLTLRKTSRIIPVLTFASVVVNVLLNFALVPRWGVYGAILATGLAFAFRNLILFRFSMRALAIPTPPAQHQATA
jgi:O-antigen/teichoic acid export membrane protein